MINMADIGANLLNNPPKEINAVISNIKSHGLLFEKYIQKCIIPLLKIIK